MKADQTDGVRGSIPACAGEPCEARTPVAGQLVYPRVCGGTLRWHRRVMPGNGLSPRVRGNLRQRNASP